MPNSRKRPGATRSNNSSEKQNVNFNLATVAEVIADAIPDREAIVWRDRRLTYAELQDRTRRFANVLIEAGYGSHVPRAELAEWESGQDHLGIYLFNGNEYLEAMLGAYKARMSPFNVNYRYVDEELIYLLNNASTRALVYHSSLAQHVESIRASVPSLELLIQVQDDDHPLLEGAIEYESLIKAADNRRPELEWDPDDLYIIYTGGTTGMPKGVLWKQSDILIATLGGRRGGGNIMQTLDQYVARAVTGDRRHLPAPPFMHGAGHWTAFQAFNTGGTVVIQDEVSRFDAAGVVSVIERENVNNMLIVGDAFGRPLIDALRAAGASCPSLKNLITGGAIMTANTKAELIELLPDVNIIDSVGSSETGGQASHVSTKKSGAATGRFTLTVNNAVLSRT